MAGKILSIEVGTYETRVVEMDYKSKSPKIHHFFTIPTPEYMVTDGSVEVNPEFVAQMKAALAEKGIRTKKAIFVLNSARIANREVMIPLVKENKIHELLVTNSAEYFPVDLVQYQLVHRIVEKDTQENKYKLSVLAVPNEMIQSYQALANALGLQIEALDYIGNSIAQGMMKLLPQELKVSVKIDETSTMITIINGDKIELQRVVSYGIYDAVEVVMENPAFGERKTFEQAMEQMKNQNCVKEEEVAENLTPLLGNIRRIIDYYTSRNQEVALNEVWLFGKGADCMGLSELLAAELNLQVYSLSKLPEKYSFTKKSDEETFAVPIYVICVAATIAPLNFNLSDGKKSEGIAKLTPKGELGYATVVCAVCLAVAAVMLVYSMVSTNVLKSENKNLQAQIDKLSEAKLSYNTYVGTKTQYDSLKDMYALTETPDDNLLAFLAEMEEKMPSEISVASLTAGTDGVNMNVSVSSKAAASKVLMQLRDFETVDSVDCPGISESESSGRVTVTFSVYCTYAVE